MAKELGKCRECDIAPAVYDIGVTGNRIETGYCRSCFERLAARYLRGGIHTDRTKRSLEKREVVHETKFGVDR